MKSYKIFRWFLKASALTTVMFIMQACYGSPNMLPDMPEDEEEAMEIEVPVSDTLIQVE